MSFTPSADSTALIGQAFDGAYQVVRIVGSGGLGVVYEAEHKQLRQRRAVKVLKLETLRDPKTAIERLWREARACSTLRGAGAVDVYDARVEQPGGRPYYAMELLSGISLHTQWMTAPGRQMPPVDALNCIRQVAGCMAVAHAAGIVHRDLKPENIFLCRDGAVKVLDFGCAHIGEEPRLTAPGAIIGVPHYMPPEQLDFKRSKPDPRMDIYALGVTLYHVLSGRHVYPQHHDPVVVAKDVHIGPPRDLADVAPELPVKLHTLVRRAIARNPEDRFQTMEMLEAELSMALRTGGVLRVGPNATTLARTGQRTKKTLLQRLLPRRDTKVPPLTPTPSATAPTLPTIGTPVAEKSLSALPERQRAQTPIDRPKTPAVESRRSRGKPKKHRLAPWVVVGACMAAGVAATAYVWRRVPVAVRSAPASTPIVTVAAPQSAVPPYPMTVESSPPPSLAIVAPRETSPPRPQPARLAVRHSKPNPPRPVQRSEQQSTTEPKLDENLNGLANPFVQ